MAGVINVSGVIFSLLSLKNIHLITCYVWVTKQIFINFSSKTVLSERISVKQYQAFLLTYLASDAK